MCQEIESLKQRCRLNESSNKEIEEQIQKYKIIQEQHDMQLQNKDWIFEDEKKKLNEKNNEL